MNETLFDAPPVTVSALTGKAVARTSHPEPSHEAAERASKGISQKRADVLIVLDEIGAATAEQVREEMRRRGIQVSESGPRSRLAELRDEYGYVREVRRADNKAVFATSDRGHTAANDLRAAQGEKAA